MKANHWFLIVLVVIISLWGCSKAVPKIETVEKGASDGTAYFSLGTLVAIQPPKSWTIKEISSPLSDKLRFDAPENIGRAMMQIERAKQKADHADGAPEPYIVNNIKIGVNSVSSVKIDFLNEGTSKLRGLSVYAADLLTEALVGRYLIFYKNGYQYAISYLIARDIKANQLGAEIKKSLATIEFK